MIIRKLLMIPGPIEFEAQVINAMSVHTPSHVAPDFIESFGHSLEMMRDVWMCQSGQPFIMAGSGTLAMDIAGSVEVYKLANIAKAARRLARRERKLKKPQHDTFNGDGHGR